MNVSRYIFPEFGSIYPFGKAFSIFQSRTRIGECIICTCHHCNLILLHTYYP
uniref:Uncharacterized protein n=1 Tax=Rhizophora mucronata TaxID=61149 RepID=A0A2P2PH69_RHIMU